MNGSHSQSTRRIGPYQLQSLLGAGGMGEVYLARDTKLGRDVAIKLLARAATADRHQLARFEREARMLAALNHPNVAAIYGVEEVPPDAASGQPGGAALVLELVAGATLADRLERGRLPLDEALRVARQVADALDAAHEAGIIHRDLKPANIKLRPDGMVKVLDFGLAKLVEPERTAAEDAQTATQATREGAILGTPSYMSPEQARGLPLDKRADVWAFGCVLYEMLSGVRPFRGSTVTDVLAAVVDSEPDLARVPPSVQPLLRRCFEKDVRRRLRDIGDAMSLIDVSGERTIAAPGATAPRLGRRPPLGWAAFAITVPILAFVSLAHFRERPAALAPTRLQLTLPDGVSAPQFTLSPDGRSLLLQLQTGGETRLALRALETGETRELPGTGGAGRGFWSPNGTRVGFTSGGALKTVAAVGGVPELVVPHGVERGAVATGCWSNGQIVFVNDANGFSRVSERGGTPTLLTTVEQARGEIHHESPSCLPDGRFLYFRHLQVRGTSGIYVGRPDLSPEKQNLTPLLVADDGPLFVPGTEATRSQLLFMRGDTLFAQGFRPDRVELLGQPARLVDGVASGSGTGYFSATESSVLVYRKARSVTRQLTWLDRDGRVAGTLGEPQPFVRGLRIAPDGSAVALGLFPRDQRESNDDVWILPFAEGPLRRLHSDPSVETSPVWAADASRIAFASNRGGRWAIYGQAIDGTRVESLSAPTSAPPTLTSWSRDGRFLLMTMPSEQTREDIFALAVTPDATTRPSVVPLVQTAFREAGAAFSPDGRHIAYVSDESGQNEIYLRSFSVAPGGAPVAPDAGKRLVSNGARGAVRWRRDGRELLYMSADGKLMSVELTTVAGLRVQPPRPLFSFPPEYLRVAAGNPLIDVLPDASRILVPMPPKEAPRSELEVVLNWR